MARSTGDAQDSSGTPALDESVVDGMGLGGLPDLDKQSLLDAMYVELEERVGRILAAGMSDEQLEEFGGFVDTNDEAGALAWLKMSFPDYQATVTTALEELKAEVAENADEILDSLGADDEID